MHIKRRLDVVVRDAEALPLPGAPVDDVPTASFGQMPPARRRSRSKTPRSTGRAAAAAQRIVSE